MCTYPDDGSDIRVIIPAPRRSPDPALVMADDRLIEEVRMGRVTRGSSRLARMLAEWRRSVLA